MPFLVHVSSAESREIHAFLMDPQSGRLTFHQKIAVPGTGAPTRGNIPLVWSRDRKVLYAQNRIAPFPLSAFALDPGSGQLELIETVDQLAPMAYLSTSLDGRFLLGASYDGALLCVNRLDADGRIAMPYVQTVRTPPKAHCILEAPFGGLVYATSVDGEVILAWRFDAGSGRLDERAPIVTPTRPGSGPRHLVFHPTLDTVYCINEEAGSLTVYAVDRESGALHEVQYESLMPAEFSGRALGADLHLTPDGALLYASVRKTNAITSFRVDPTSGLLSRTGVFEVEPNPRGFAIEPDGRFLLCAGQLTDSVAIYAIDAATGALSVIERHSVGKRPSWIEIVPGPTHWRGRVADASVRTGHRVMPPPA